VNYRLQHFRSPGHLRKVAREPILDPSHVVVLRLRPGEVAREERHLGKAKCVTGEARRDREPVSGLQLHSGAVCLQIHCTTEGRVHRGSCGRRRFDRCSLRLATSGYTLGEGVRSRCLITFDQVCEGLHPGLGRVDTSSRHFGCWRRVRLQGEADLNILVMAYSVGVVRIGASTRYRGRQANQDHPHPSG
jgi:hypothetical protein